MPAIDGGRGRGERGVMARESVTQTGAYAEAERREARGACFIIVVGQPADPVGDNGGNDQDSEAQDAQQGTPGCYDMSTHVCECEGDEDDCDGTGGAWTDQCNC